MEITAFSFKPRVYAPEGRKAISYQQRRTTCGSSGSWRAPLARTVLHFHGGSKRGPLTEVYRARSIADRNAATINRWLGEAGLSGRGAR